MFSDLLSLMAGIAGCSGAVIAGRHSGRLDILISWVLGLAIGFACFSGIRFVLKSLLQRFKLYEPKLPPSRLALSWFFCIASFLWVACSGFIGFWAMKLVINFPM